MNTLSTPPGQSSISITGQEAGQLQCAVSSHTGCVRTNNEDRFLIRPDIGIFAVADGMGGHEAGEIAASLTIEALSELAHPKANLDIPRRMLNSVTLANERVRAAALVHAPERGMGTTLSAIWFAHNRLVVVHVGDSRVYRMRGGVLSMLTEDHTLLAAALRAGYDPATAHEIYPGNVLVRAVGTKEDIVPMLASYTVESGDRFLICSDGLTDLVNDEAIGQRLALWPSAEQATEALVADALNAGGFDNVTVLVIDVG